MYRKYKAVKVIIDGKPFDSKKEGRRYEELKALEKQGLIKDLELQKSYELQPKFKKNGKSFRNISYVADFTYYNVETNKTVVEDVKGFKTDVYKIKKKMFEYQYPDLELREL